MVSTAPPRLLGALGLLCALVFCAMSLTGCSSSSGPETMNVQGTVTYKDKPVTSGKVQFFNNKNEVLRSTSLKGDGTFALTDIPKGEVKVTVENAPVSKILLPKAPKD